MEADDAEVSWYRWPPLSNYDTTIVVTRRWRLMPEEKFFWNDRLCFLTLAILRDGKKINLEDGRVEIVVDGKTRKLIFKVADD